MRDRLRQVLNLREEGELPSVMLKAKPDWSNMCKPKAEEGIV